VGVDGARTRAVPVSPDLGEQVLPRPHAAGGTEQVDKEIELGRGEADEIAVQPCPASRHVDLDAARSQYPIRIGGGPLRPAQQSPHPRGELAHAERLAEVVVGPDFESDDEVSLRAASGQHDHRDRPVALYLAADLKAVKTWEHQVEYHRVRTGSGDQLDRAWPVVRHGHLMSIATQPGRDRRGDLGFVFHDDDAGHTLKLMDLM
jgi:hypothetical protein